MERLVKIDAKTIQKYNPDDFALQQVFKGIGVPYEYLVENEWKVGPPKQKPEGKRVVFDLNNFRSARDVYFAWQDLEKERNERLKAELPEKAIKRLLNARRTGEPITLFTPWGIRQAGKPKLETIVLDRMASLQNMLQKRNIPTQFLVMPADLYATEINKNGAQKVTAYFEWVGKEAEKRGFIVKPWSQIKYENRVSYAKRAEILTQEEIQKLLPYPVVEGAKAAAAKRSGYVFKDQIENAAFGYMRERIVEAEIIDAVYRPIKVSMVTKTKDNGVDRDLPRIYMLPDALQFPWLK